VDNQAVERILTVDSYFRKMKERGLKEAKAICPSCGLKMLRLAYSGPRAASAKCENCDFQFMA